MWIIYDLNTGKELDRVDTDALAGYVNWYSYLCFEVGVKPASGN